MNQVVLIGRLVKDIEVKQTQAGVKVASFGLAVNRSYKKEGNPETDFFDVVAWDKTADFLEKYGAKGRRISLIGILQTRSYEAKDGTKRKATEVRASSIEFLDSPDKDKAQTATKEPTDEEIERMLNESAPWDV